MSEIIQVDSLKTDVVKIKIDNRQYEVCTRLNLNFFSCYARVKEKNYKNSRDSFCELMFLLITESGSNDITLNDIKGVKNRCLKKVTEGFMKNNDRLSIINSLNNFNFSKIFIKEIDIIMNEIASTFAPVIEGAIKFANNVSRKVRPFIDNLYTSLRSFYDSDDLKSLKSFLPNMIQQFLVLAHASGNIINQFPVTMLQAGWPPPIDMNFLSITYFVIQHYKEDNLETLVDEFMLEYYNNEAILAFLDKWKKNNFLSNRLNVLEPAIQAHIKGDYVLSIPSIIPQIEGVIAERFAHEGVLRGKHLKVYVEKLLDRHFIKSFDDSVSKFVLDILLVQFEHGRVINSSLSRHAILHGADYMYGTQTNSLKIILLFDYIQTALSKLSKNDFE